MAGEGDQEMTIEVSALEWAPEFARGYVKDLRVRWALEEAGFPYSAALTCEETRTGDIYRMCQPFGQVPAYRDDGIEMFESGAIVLHIASASEALAPSDAAGQTRVASWVFAATTSVQPHVDNYNSLRTLLPGDKRHVIDDRLHDRLAALQSWMQDKDYLEGGFTAGDLVMDTVLRELIESGVLDRFPALAAYRERCEARPAFKRALAAQLADFRDAK